MTTAREQVLAAATQAVIEDRWDRLSLAAIAADAGVSRQTVYNDFGDRRGLAQAVVATKVAGLLSVVDEAFAKAPSLPSAVETAVAGLVRSAQNDPLVRALVGGSRSSDFLAYLSVDSGFVRSAATTRIDELMTAHFPEVMSVDNYAAGVDVVVRLGLSYVAAADGLTPTEAAARVGPVAASLLQL